MFLREILMREFGVRAWVAATKSAKAVKRIVTVVRCAFTVRLLCVYCAFTVSSVLLEQLQTTAQGILKSSTLAEDSNSGRKQCFDVSWSYQCVRGCIFSSQFVLSIKPWQRELAHCTPLKALPPAPRRVAIAGSVLLQCRDSAVPARPSLQLCARPLQPRCATLRRVETNFQATRAAQPVPNDLDQS